MYLGYIFFHESSEIEFITIKWAKIKTSDTTERSPKCGAKPRGFSDIAVMVSRAML